ncbi:unnamed protein product [Cyberlindnera jadinii]|uniref:LDB19 N-terminal domain-containing protein n=1 Tax=Cyberlindnera jadinii (strain ATCC 18201 / CBS 1600 / BCRC 20928 / JCM 3617 / NBRC 0987 / NRRL Y-1542) TaxID=983966 RepID=A0A0H5C4U1_CYBJN|nr:unnamed protein product [Cyberlindnera jadinii]
MPFIPKLSATLSSNSLLSPSSSNVNNASSNQPLQPLTSVTSNNNLAHSSHPPFELSIDLESPPIILYGPPSESSGSLVSGQLNITIKKEAFQHQQQHPQRPSAKRALSSNTLQNLSQTLSNLNLSPAHSHNGSPIHSKNNSSTNLMSLLNVKDHVLINSVRLTLYQNVHYAKPFLPPSNTLSNCTSCKKKSTELARWDVMTQAHNLPAGKHSYPFSHLLPGALPATTCLGSSGITTIKYELVAIVSYNTHNNHQNIVKVALPVNIARSVLRGPDRNSLRVFPPTDVTATAVLPNVVYPKSSFALELKLDGVSSSDRRWRMRRVGWRIEEQVKVKTNSCENHKSKLKVIEQHYRKNPMLTKNNVKRNQQSGPTTSFSVSNAASLTPMASNNLSAQQTREGVTPTVSASNEDRIVANGSNDNDNDDQISSTNNLHPSDHANEELRLSQLANAQAQAEDYSLYSQEIRTVATGDLRNGWKSDFSGKGKIELVADISCFGLSSASGPHRTHVSSNNPLNLPPVHPTISCDIDDPVLGIYCSHVLIVEVVIAEEVLQNSSSASLTTSTSHTESLRREGNRPDQRLAELSPVFANHVKPTKTEPANTSRKPEDPSSINAVVGVPTGSARVLRMQFKLNITERSGLGIAWDDEVPPMYEDVSALSPPTYDTAMSPYIDSPQVSGANPPLYPLNAAHTHTAHINGSSGAATPGVIYGIGNTPGITPRPSANFQSLNGALDIDEFTLN